MRKKFVLFLTSILLCAFGVAQAKVAMTSLEDLTNRSPVIVIARVNRVSTVNGIKVAESSVIRSIKGKLGSNRFIFLAQPSWTCDASTAVEGETVLMFLLPANSSQGFHEQFRDKMQQAGKSLGVPAYFITHSGFGRIPFEWKNEQPFLRAFRSSDDTLWAGGASLPDQLKRVAKPDPKYPRTSFISLKNVEIVIRQWLQKSARALKK